MGKKTRVIVTLIDDLNGTEMAEGEGETITFALDGTNYEIDVTDENAANVRKLFGPIIEAGRRVSGKRNRPSRAGQGTIAGRQIGSGSRSDSGGGAAHPTQAASFTAAKNANRELRREIRQWANDNGFDQPASGRIREDVVTAWNEAHPDRPMPEFEGRNSNDSRLTLAG